MAMTDEQQAVTAIALDRDAGLGRTWLEIEDIEAIARRLFP
jgi:hypothetical protein